MRHEAVYIAFQCDGRVLMAEDFGQRFDVHAAFERTGGKRMPQGVKSAVRNAEAAEKKAETVLIRTH